MSTYIDSDTIPIGQFLSNVIALKVPMFQRSYAWTDEEVKQLWIDITEAMDSDETEYFLGPMVLKQSSTHLEIIDGQQRVATVYIILSVIRRILRANHDNDRADWFNNEYFGKRDIITLELQPKFQMNEVNDPIFQKLRLPRNSRVLVLRKVARLFKLFRTLIAQSRMTTAPIVKSFNVGKDVSSGLGTGQISLMMS